MLDDYRRKAVAAIGDFGHRASLPSVLLPSYPVILTKPPLWYSERGPSLERAPTGETRRKRPFPWATGTGHSHPNRTFGVRRSPGSRQERILSWRRAIAPRMAMIGSDPQFQYRTLEEDSDRDLRARPSTTGVAAPTMASRQTIAAPVGKS